MNHSVRFESRKTSTINAKAIGFTIAFAIVGTLFLLTGCGGGGGGGVNLPAAGVPYEGSKTQATLDATTAEAITNDLAGAELEDLSGNATAASTVGISDSDGKALRYAAFERFKQDAFYVLEENLNPSVSGNSHIAVGNCNDLLGASYSNGSASVAVLEQNPSKITVKATYSSLCQTDVGLNYAVVLNGDMYMVISGSNLDNASGRIDSLRLYMPSITVAYTDLTVPVTTTATITEDWIMDFTYDVDGFLSGTTFSIGVNVSFNGKVYRFESVSDDGLTFTQKFYHPDHGYVEITVAGTFTYGSCADPYTPDGGSVTITGSDGVGFSVAYQVTVIDCFTRLVTGPLL